MKIKPRTVVLNEKSEHTQIAQHVLTAHPGAEIVRVKSNTHSWNGRVSSTDPDDHYFEKATKIGVLHRNAKWKADPNGRSTDFLPSQMLVQGCAFFCEYCYCLRHYVNNYPKVYDDALKMVEFVDEVMHNLPQYEELFEKVCKKSFEKDRDSRHSPYVTFDIGCDSDCTLDNQLTRHSNYPGHVIDIMNGIGAIPGALVSFATKGDSFDSFIADCKYPNKNRIRLSIMPEHHRRILEKNTAPIINRLNAVNKLVAAGFEVHINLSPVVITKDLKADFGGMLKLIDDTLSSQAKAQMAYEIIMLTHSESLFNAVEFRNKEAHDLMVNGPLRLVPKWNKPNVLSYKRQSKEVLKKFFAQQISNITPYARIRYMF